MYLSEQRIDLTESIALVEKALQNLNELNGRVKDSRPNDRDLAAVKRETSQGLLFTAHLLDCSRLSVTNDWHRFKGQDTPEIHLPE